MRKLSSIFCAVLVGTATVAAAEPAYAFELSRGASRTVNSILPEKKPDEPLLLLVSLREQSMRVYAGDRLVARSNVSTGTFEHETPTGIFSILEKRRYHESNIYSQAPMPFMQRLTWSGIALHESDSVPDYPASHGCVRLPGAFARSLFGFTEPGAHVLITEESLDPKPIRHRNLIYPGGPPDLTSAPETPEPAVELPTVEFLSTGSQSVMSIVEYKAEDEAEEATLDDEPVNPIGDDLALRNGIDAIEPPRTVGADDAGFVMPESRDPIRVLITRRTGRHLVSDIQTMLNELDLDAGDADGLIGPDTGNAIVAYQKQRGLQPTGTVSVALARMLHEDTGRRPFPTGHLYVRQGFKPLFDAPVILRDATAPLGTHFFAALESEQHPDRIRWIHTSLTDRPRQSPLLDVQPRRSSFFTGDSVNRVLDRIDLPDYLRDRLTTLMVPGSSIIITDNGLSDESHLGTDFIVLTNTSAELSLITSN
jgi:peptidoglycan hydrolase-like protein with peptidoglycan-binding domain